MIRKWLALLLIGFGAAQAAPTISVQPTAITVVAGHTAAFAVVAICVPSCTYQWKKGGVDIGGATSIAYTTPAIVAGDNGASFTVVVTDGAGNTTSSGAVLTVYSLPSIISQPVAPTASRFSSMTITATAGGSGSLSYQWKKNGVNISGANISSYTISSPGRSDDGSYTVVVSNDSGSATSNATILRLSGWRLFRMMHRTGNK